MSLYFFCRTYCIFNQVPCGQEPSRPVGQPYGVPEMRSAFWGKGAIFRKRDVLSLRETLHNGRIATRFGTMRLSFILLVYFVYNFVSDKFINGNPVIIG